MQTKNGEMLKERFQYNKFLKKDLGEKDWLSGSGELKLCYWVGLHNLVNQTFY